MLRRKNRATAWVAVGACMAAAIVPPTWADRGHAVVKRFPQRTETLVIAPESVDSAAYRESTSHPGEPVRFEFDGGYTLVQSFPLDREAGVGMVVTLVDPVGFRQSWTLSPTFEDDIRGVLAKWTSPEGTNEVQAAAARGESIYDVLGQAFTRSLDPDDLVAVMALGRAMEPIGRQAISRSLDATVRPLLESGLPQSVLAGGTEHTECPGAIATAFLWAGSAFGCWLVTPLDVGIHAAGCAALTIGLGGAVLNIMSHCGGGPWDGCSCWPVKNCMCCTVAEGEECLCHCGTSDREPCCDWDKAADEGRVGPSVKKGDR